MKMKWLFFVSLLLTIRVVYAQLEEKSAVKAQKDLDWTYFVYYNGEGSSGSNYNKETGVVSSASGDVKVILR